MALPVEDTALTAAALAYVGKLYRELTSENGSPTLGTQNQAIDFILGDPELSRALGKWAATAAIGEASMTPPARLPPGPLYDRVRACLEGIMEPPVFATANPSRP